MFIPGLLPIALVSASKITVDVRGTFLCDNDDQHDVHVELWERDMITGDDLLGEINVAPFDFFRLKGAEKEWLHIDPYLVIKHKCNGVCFCTFIVN
ncbi:Transthyretin-like family protein [Cooperia oncophora]